MFMRDEKLAKRIAQLFLNEKLIGFKIKSVCSKYDGFGAYKFWILSDNFKDKTRFESISIVTDILFAHVPQKDRVKVWALSTHTDEDEMHAHVMQWNGAKYLPEL